MHFSVHPQPRSVGTSIATGFSRWLRSHPTFESRSDERSVVPTALVTRGNDVHRLKTVARGLSPLRGCLLILSLIAVPPASIAQNSSSADPVMRAMQDE